MTWREAEFRAADHMRALGFADAEATSLGIDQGVDVRATGGIAQVKHYTSTLVGSPEVQRLRGAAHDIRWAIFYSRSGYTMSAVNVAAQLDVALFEYDDETVTPVSEHAITLSRTGYVAVKFGDSTTARESMLSHLANYVQQTTDLLGEALIGTLAIANNLSDRATPLTDRQKELLREILRELPEMLDLMKELKGGELPLNSIFTKIARLEHFAMLQAELNGEPIEEIAARANDRRVASGFVATAELLPSSE